MMRDTESDLGSAFRSPSGNVTCILSDEDDGYATCILKAHSYRNESKPASCDRYWATDHVRLTTRRGVEGGACLGGLDYDPSSVRTQLPYGTSTEDYVLACRSESVGISCADITTGIGFTVSREALIRRRAADTIPLPATPSSAAAIAGNWSAHDQFMTVSASGAVRLSYSTYADNKGLVANSLRVNGHIASIVRAGQVEVATVRADSVKTDSNWDGPTPRVGQSLKFVQSRGLMYDPVRRGARFCSPTLARKGSCGA